MLDIKFVRENPDAVDKSCESRQNAHWDRQKFFELDEERRSVIAEVEKLQADRNAVSKQIGLLMKDGKKDEAEAAKAQVAANKERIAELGEKRAAVEQELFDLVAAIPNIPHESVPYGKDDSDNPEVRRWGTPREFDFEPKAHWDLGPELGMIDFDRGVKLAGTRFYLLGGMGAGAAYTFVRALSKRKEKSARIVFFFSAFSTLTALPFVIADFHPMTFAQFMCLMGAGAAATLGQFGVTLAYLHAPAKEISVFDYTQVLFSAALGFFMFGQIPDGLSVLGYIVICGVSVAMFCYNRHLDAGEQA